MKLKKTDIKSTVYKLKFAFLLAHGSEQKYTRLSVKRFSKEWAILCLILKVLYIEVFKLNEIKETKPGLYPNQYVKLRENVIGRCAITRDECICIVYALHYL